MYTKSMVEKKKADKLNNEDRNIITTSTAKNKNKHLDKSDKSQHSKFKNLNNDKDITSMSNRKHYNSMKETSSNVK